MSLMPFPLIIPKPIMAEISSFERGGIIALHEEGYSLRKIATRNAWQTVEYTIQRFRIHSTGEPLPRSGARLFSPIAASAKY